MLQAAGSQSCPGCCCRVLLCSVAAAAGRDSELQGRRRVRAAGQDSHCAGRRTPGAVEGAAARCGCRVLQQQAARCAVAGCCRRLRLRLVQGAAQSRLRVAQGAAAVAQGAAAQGAVAGCCCRRRLRQSAVAGCCRRPRLRIAQLLNAGLAAAKKV